jgi:hypothetical protein
LRLCDVFALCRGFEDFNGTVADGLDGLDVGARGSTGCPDY